MLFFILFVAGEGGGDMSKNRLSSNPELKVADYMCEKKNLPEVSIEAETSTNLKDMVKLQYIWFHLVRWHSDPIELQW